MQTIVSTARAVAASSTLRALARLPAQVVRGVLIAPSAFIDAIERFATKY